MRLLTCLIVLAATTAAADKPADRAKAFVQTQLAAMTKANDAAVKATFAADAILLGGTFDSSVPIAKQDNVEFQGFLMNGSPHSGFRTASIKSVVAGGTDAFVWLTAEISATYASQEPEQKAHTVTHVVRMTELVVADGSTWKCVAAVFDRPGPVEGHYEAYAKPVGGATKPGGNRMLLASVGTVAAGMMADDPNAFALGTEAGERGIGPAAARKLLKAWSDLPMNIVGDSREVETKAYAFVQGKVAFKLPDKDDHSKNLIYPMSALVIAIPAHGGWNVVALHYAND